MLMTTTSLYLLLAIIAVLTVVVSVLLWRNFRNQRELRDKNDVIIREIRENTQLRDELRDAWRRKGLQGGDCRSGIAGASRNH